VFLLHLPKHKNTSLEMQMLNPWVELSFQAARLGWEAQNMMALRLMQLAGGDAAGQSAAPVTEKVVALSEAHTAAKTAPINGRNVAKRVLNVYKKRVRGNKRKLSK
jgi:hypothetical protein